MNFRIICIVKCLRRIWRVASTMFLEPPGIPQRILGDRVHQSGTKRIGHNVASNMLKLLGVTNDPIVKSPLPDRAMPAQNAIYPSCRERLYRVDGKRQRSVTFRQNQPVEMIGHDNERKALCVAGLALSSH